MVDDNENKTYEDGLIEGRAEAWTLAKRLVLSPLDGGYLHEEINAMFGDKTSFEVLKSCSPEEVLEKTQAYDARISLEVNDEILVRGKKGIITFLYEDNTAEILLHSGMSLRESVDKLSKTGRHFDIQSLLTNLN